MDLEIKKDLTSNWFKLLQDAFCNDIVELENNKNSLILSAESTALHLWVITVMDILNKNGFNEVQIRTIEK